MLHPSSTAPRSQDKAVSDRALAVKYQASAIPIKARIRRNTVRAVRCIPIIVPWAPCASNGDRMTSWNPRKYDETLREALTPDEFRVLREGGTELSFSGVLLDNHDSGMYRCKVCGAALFSSDKEFIQGVAGLRLPI